MNIDRRSARRRALLAAHRTLISNGVDLTSPVDVFGLLRAAGLIVAFRPMPRLAGAYLSASHSAAGVIINNNHPLSKQRFTAAHELGHHLLGHGKHLDLDTDVGERVSSASVEEIEAEAFAGFLLLPRVLLKHIADKSPRDFGSPEHCYQMSLALGVSYLAAATQMRVYGHISGGTYTSLAAVPPAKIKRTLVGDPMLAVGAADVIDLGAGVGLPATVRPEDLILVPTIRDAEPRLGPLLRLHSQAERNGTKYWRIHVEDMPKVNPSCARIDTFVELTTDVQHTLTIQVNRQGVAYEDIEVNR